MATCEPTSSPTFSIIIAVHDDWGPLQGCLNSLGEQRNAPGFEVIVVDDGSAESAPESIRQWSSAYPITLERQPHAGVSVARNRGLQFARGVFIVFVDADSRLRSNCLATLAETIARFPDHNFFQLHLVGNSSTLVGRTEELRLTTIQNHMLRPDGSIRYLNTAGFAIRRSKVEVATGLFDPAARRGEDTLLLVTLMQRGELPFFVSEAVVEHAVALSLSQYLRKAIRSAYLEAGTYKMIAAKGVSIRVSHGERVQMLSSMWRASRQPGIGRGAWFVLLARQALPRLVSFSYRLASPDRRS